MRAEMAHIEGMIDGMDNIGDMFESQLEGMMGDNKDDDMANDGRQPSQAAYQKAAFNKSYQ